MKFKKKFLFLGLFSSLILTCCNFATKYNNLNVSLSNEYYEIGSTFDYSTISVYMAYGEETIHVDYANFDNFDPDYNLKAYLLRPGEETKYVNPNNPLINEAGTWNVVVKCFSSSGFSITTGKTSFIVDDPLEAKAIASLELNIYKTTFEIEDTLELSQISAKLHYSDASFDTFEYEDFSKNNITLEVIKPNQSTSNVNDDIVLDTEGTWKLKATYSLDDVIKTNTISFVVEDNRIIVEDITKTKLSYIEKDYYKQSPYDDDCCPSKGNIHLLVIPVWFNDSSSYINDSNKQRILNDINKAYFGSNSDTGWRSVKTYYEELSNGAITITGTTSEWYSCNKKASNYYTDSDGSKTMSLVKNATNWYFNKYTTDSRSNYDSDKNGYLDGVILIYGAPDYSTSAYSPTNNYDNMWAYTYWVQDSSLFNKTNPGVNTFFWASYDFMYSDGTDAKNATGKSSAGTGDTNFATIDTHTFIHEMGHVFGLDDYYDYSQQYNPGGGFSMQDYNVGSHDPYSAMVLGWADPYIPTKSMTIEIGTFQKTHDLILLTPSWNSSNSPFDEYFLLELYSPTGLNKFDSEHTYNDSTYPRGPSSVGIRLWHVDSRLVVMNSRGTDGTIYNYPTEGNEMLCSNTYYIAGDYSEDYCSPMRVKSKNYCDYNLLQLIRNNTRTTYRPSTSDDLDANDLFRNSSSFDMSTFSSQFKNTGKLNSNVDLDWSFTVVINGDGENAKATIALTKTN